LNYTALLKKIIEIQHKIIKGDSIGSVLAKETPSLMKYTHADIILIAIGDGSFVNIEFTMKNDRKNFFCKLADEYGLMSKPLFINNIIKHIGCYHDGNRKYSVINSLHQIFDGTFSQEKSSQFEKEINFHKSYVFEIQDKDTNRIGFILYIFKKGKTADIKSMTELTSFFENLFDSLYDKESQRLYTQLISIDNDMSILTEKEKEITSLIIHGYTYKEIALKLKVTINTIKTHTKSIFSKYGVSSKMELQNKLLHTP